MWPNPQFPANLVTFTEEIFNGKLHFLWAKQKEEKRRKKERTFSEAKKDHPANKFK